MENIEAVESMFLGTLGRNPQNVLDAITLIKAGASEPGKVHLHVPKHQTILEAMEACSLESPEQWFEIEDLIAKLATLNKLELVGGETYIRKVYKVGSPADGSWRAHAQNVIRTFQTRIAVEAGQQLAEAAASQKQPLPDILADAQEKISSIRKLGVKPPTIPFGDIVLERREARKDRIANSIPPGVISSGFKALDSVIQGGFYPGRTYLFGAVMNMCKSTVMRSFAARLTDHGGPGIIYSTEEPPQVWFEKLLACKMGVNSNKVAMLDLTEEEWMRMEELEDQLADSGCIMSTNSSPSPLDVYDDTQAGVIRHNTKWIIVDSASKMSAGKDGIFNDTRAVSQCLQNVALDMNIPVLMSAQLIKDVNLRENKIGNLWDFQGGITFSQDMDVAFTLFLEDFYVKRGAIKWEDRKFDPGILSMPMVRNRHGDGGDISVEFFIQLGVGLYPVTRMELNPS